MPTFRYDTSGKWYKGNTHIHSTASDGGLNFTEIARLYAGAGYHFLYRTDHWVASDVDADRERYPLLWLDGIELDGPLGGGAYHVACLGKVKGLTREAGFPAALEAAHDEGAMLILAHPHWMGNTLEDALRWPFDGVEIYNHVCRWLNGKGGGEFHWTAMMEKRPGTLAFACDDSHVRPEHPGWNGGWVMINAPELSREAIGAAIRAGNFYSSCGPEFHSITCHGDAVHITCSPVQFIRLVGHAWNGTRIGSFDGTLRTEATFPIPPNWPYVYLEIEDTLGRRAWTNPLLVPGG